MSPMRPLTYGSPVTPRNTANISRPSEELLPVRFRWVKPAASLKPPLELPRFRWVKPAASLKPTERCFRWVKPAASLKRSCWGQAIASSR